MKKHYDYLVVGAGLFGSTFARCASDAGRSCLVVDKRNNVAGNAYTENVCGINVHKYGAHIFHTDDEEVWQFVNRFAEFNDFVNTPLANYNGELFNLPFNMNTFCKMWGDLSPEQAAKKIEEQRSSFKGIPENLEEQAISLVGVDIYNKLVKGYTEKQWGKPCRELPSFIIKRIPVRFTFDNNYFDDKYQGIPVGGYTKMIENMLDGIDVLLNTDFLADKSALCSIADKVIFTGRIDEFFACKFGELEYRTLKFETEILNQREFQKTAVVNFTDAKPPFTRIIEHKHFENADTDKTVITREYPSAFKKGDEPYYPVNDKKNQELYEKYHALADKEKKIIFGGRLGEYKYYDMDDTVKSALSLFKKEQNSGY